MKLRSVTRGAALTGGLTLLDAARAVAASGENTPLNLSSPPSKAAHVASGGSGLLRMVIALIAVVAVIYGITWLLKQARKSRSRISGSGLHQLANLPLGGGRSLALVRAGDEVVLVGVAEQGVTALRTYTRAEALASGLELPPDEDYGPPAPEPRGNGVIDVLRRMTVRS